MASLCCPIETPIEHEARLSAAQLKSAPIHIWWHRRRIHGPTSSLLSKNDESANRSIDKSPFPKSWSINYTLSDESSVFSTVSQELQLRRDAFGNCLKHPHIQLARRKPTTKSRFTKMFSKSSTGGDNSQREEWDIVRKTCPECEKECTEKSKARYHYKSNKLADVTHQQLNSSGLPPIHPRTVAVLSPVTHVPFPATLTLIDSHPHLAEGTLALKVRTDAIPTEQTMHLSCAAAGIDRGSFWKWNTPDGALDFLLPADSNGEIMQVPDTAAGKKCNSDQVVTPTKKKRNSPQYQIMERIIPISSVDHISRGGDAWDVLRQSTGEKDYGCSCDVKIHGFCERLLRFDVVNFDTMQSNGANDCGLRYSFAGVEFSQSSVLGVSNNFSNEKGRHADIDPSNNLQSGSHSDSYTTENVIPKLNSIVLWQREARKTGVARWMSDLTNWMEECLSLGVPKVDDPSVSVNGEKSSIYGPGRFDIDSNYGI